MITKNNTHFMKGQTYREITYRHNPTRISFTLWKWGEVWFIAPWRKFYNAVDRFDKGDGEKFSSFNCLCSTCSEKEKQILYEMINLYKEDIAEFLL